MLKPIAGRDHGEFEHGEEIQQAKPFRHSIRVHWGDCDPARIAYRPIFPPGRSGQSRLGGSITRASIGMRSTWTITPALRSCI